MALMLLPIALVGVIWLWPVVWFRMVRDRIVVRCQFGQREVMMEESTRLDITVENRSLLPCPFVRITIDLPEGLSTQPDRSHQQLRVTSFLLMRQTIRLHCNVYGRSRGVQEIRACLVHLNEGFGLRDLLVTLDTTTGIAVLPNPSAESSEHWNPEAISGSVELQRWMHPDEAVLNGLRAYQPGDPLKNVSWAATARTGELVTKQFSSSTSMVVTLMVNAQFFDPFWVGTRRDRFDDLCARAVRVALQLEARGAQLSFATNAVVSDSPLTRWFGLQRASSIQSLLGRAAANASGPLEAALVEWAVRREDADVLILFTGFLTSEQRSRLHDFQRRGFPLVLVQLADDEAGDPGAVSAPDVTRKEVTYDVAHA